MPEIRVKRAYEPRSPGDGRRVLLNRLWPRGLSKHDLADGVWIRDVTPSAGLRNWFGQKPERWEEFRTRYLAELRAGAALETLKDVIRTGPVTLVCGAKDEAHNQAVALAEYLHGETRPAEEARR